MLPRVNTTAPGHFSTTLPPMCQQNPSFPPSASGAPACVGSLFPITDVKWGYRKVTHGHLVENAR